MESTEFCQAIEQFNQKEFYACHDTLEALWMEASEPHKTFYQGILQVSVGCYHLNNSNWRGAVILLGEGIRKLRDYEPDYGEIDITNLIKVSADLLKYLQKIDPKEINTVVIKLQSNDPILEITYPKIIKIKIQSL